MDFTKAAVGDLQSIREYTLTAWGPKQEDAYLDSLWRKFEEILGEPEKWRRRDDLFPGCRVAAHEKHVLLFRIDGELLQIVRILHGAMDFRRHIDDPHE